MVYEKVFHELQDRGVRYAVAGGVAMALHGVLRFTADLDLFVDLSRDNVERFLRAMERLGYVPRSPVKAGDLLDPAARAAWKRDKGMVVFSFIDPADPTGLIDLFIEEPVPFAGISGGIIRMTAKGITIPVLSIADLKKLKRLSGRPQDLADIEALERLEEDGA